MKKLLAILLSSSLLMCGCVATKEENFEEIEKIDLEVSDYVNSENAQTEIEPENASEKEPENIEEEKPENVSEKEPENVEEKAESADTVTKTKDEVPKETVESEIPDTQETPVPTETPVQQEPAPVNVSYSEMNLSGKTICIDAAHGLFTENKNEGIAPGRSLIKPGFKEGTKGVYITEDEVTLAVANILKQKLEAKGATVLMTRTDSNATLSNVERAEYANNNGADICIKLHADGTEEGGSGMTMLVPGKKYINDNNLIAKSKLLGKAVLNGAVAKTGAAKRGVYSTSGMTGFNWSKIPVVLLEMGYLTNPYDEAKLSDFNYQNLIADGIVEGILEYYK